MSVKSILGWAALAFAAFWVIEKPTGATHIAAHIGGFLTSAVHGIRNFFASI